MLKQPTLRLTLAASFMVAILFANALWAQNAQIVVGGNSFYRDTVKAAFYLKGGQPIKESQFTTGGTNSLVNDLGGGNSSSALNSLIGSGQNNTIAPNAAYGVIVGGLSNSIQNLAPPDTSAFNFISNGENNTIEHGTRHSSILGGSHNVIATGAFNSVILGGDSITAVQSNTVYAPNMAVTGLAGSGERQLMVDSAGNLKAMPVFPPPPCSGLLPDWKTDGNNLPSGPNCDPFIGSKNAADLVFKTNFNDVINGGERMRITAIGNIGIGTLDPKHHLHLHTTVPDPGDPQYLRQLDTTLHFDTTGAYFPEPVQNNPQTQTFQITNNTTTDASDKGLLFWDKRHIKFSGCTGTQWFPAYSCKRRIISANSKWKYFSWSIRIIRFWQRAVPNTQHLCFQHPRRRQNADQQCG